MDTVVEKFKEQVKKLRNTANTIEEVINMIESLSGKLDVVMYFRVLPVTIFNKLFRWMENPAEYIIDILDNIQTAEENKKYFLEHPDEADEEEIQYINNSIEEGQGKLKDMIKDSLEVIEYTFFEAANTITSLSETLDDVYFGVLPESLLSHMLYWGYNPKNYLDTIENIQTAEEDKKYFLEHPDEADEEEVQYIDSDVEEWEKELRNIIRSWKKSEKVNKVNMEKELALIKRWVEKRGGE